MKKFALAIAAACVALVPVSATASTPLAQHGPFTVAALDDMQTCAFGASNGTVGFYLTYNANTDKLAFSGTNTKYTTVTSGTPYTVNITLDGKTVTWKGQGIVLKNGGGQGVVVEAGDSLDAAKALYEAKTVTMSFARTGTKIVDLNSDANFENALKDTIACSFMLQDMAKGTTSSSTKKPTKGYVS